MGDFAGSRTATGKPILANDPHLDLAAPILWYLARIVTPERFARRRHHSRRAGRAARPERPHRLGLHHRRYRHAGSVRRDARSRRPHRYLTPDGPQPSRRATRPSTSRARPTCGCTCARRGTGRCSPTSTTTCRPSPGRARRWRSPSPASATRTRPSTPSVGLAAAKNWSEFLAAMRLFQTPTQNIVYADVDGNIGLHQPRPRARAQVRRRPDAGRRRLGRSIDWTGFCRSSSCRKCYNPGAGFLFNANNAVVAPSEEPSSAAIGKSRSAPAAFSNSSIARKSTTSTPPRRCRAIICRSAMLALKPLMASIKPADDRARQALARVAAWNGDDRQPSGRSRDRRDLSL